MSAAQKQPRASHGRSPRPPAAQDQQAAQSRSGATQSMRSLEYGLGLLERFTAQAPERGVSELAAELAVSPSTAHRYASTCLELGYLEQAPMRRYRLARRSSDPGRALIESLEVVRAARPILRELREATGRTVALAELDGASVLYLQRLCGFQRGSYVLERGLGSGSRRPAGDTAAGLALLAADNDPVLHAGGLHPRALGIAVAVAAGDGQLSALEITAPADAIGASDALDRLTGRLREAARELRASLARELGADKQAAGAAGPGS